jgi:hypothetical protein
MQVAIATSVASVPIQRPMLGMDIELDSPTDLRHCEIDSSQATAVPHDARLMFNRYATVSQLFSKHDFGMRLAR